jgi:alcohol dehydrogenase
MTLPFSFHLPTRIEFGNGASHQVGDEVTALARRHALVVFDEGIRSAGLADGVLDDLADSAVAFTVFSNVSPNPRLAEIMNGVRAAQANECDVVVAIGGGSSLDAAKAIALVLTNGGSIVDYEGWDRVPRPSTPLVTIPTTAGSGAEATYWAVISDTERRCKFSVGSSRIAPTVALVDPELTLGLPSWLTASTGIDALTHAVESYTATIAQPITDSCAMAAIRLIAGNLREACANGKNRRAREGMMLASCLAGITVGISSTAAVHCLSEAVGGTYDTPHGVANALFLPAVTEFNWIAAPGRYARIAEALGLPRGSMPDVDAARHAATLIRQLISDVDVSLAEVHIRTQDMAHLARVAMDNLAREVNPRTATEEDFLRILGAVRDDQPPDARGTPVQNVAGR